MAFVVLFLVAALFGVYGYVRGGLRFGLNLAPLLLGSILLSLFGRSFYRIDSLRNSGLIWPGLILLLTGLIGGYVLRFWAYPKLSKEIHRADRISGAVVGVMVSVAVVWLGCVYYIVLSRQPSRVSGSTAQLARTLNSGVLRWVPVVGTASNTMMNMTAIATASEDVRQQVVQDLALKEFLDIPQMQAVLDDDETQDDIQEAAKGSLSAIWRLQKNVHILKLLESQEFAEALDRHSLDDIVEAIRIAQQSQEE